VYSAGVWHPYRRHQTATAVLQVETGAALGVALLNSKIYVICFAPETVNVFSDEPPYTRHKDVLVKGINPRDIASFSYNDDYLYVADPYSNCVWKVNVNTNGDVEKFVPNAGMNDAFTPWAMSVKASSRMLVTSENQLYVFDADGRQLLHVQLPDNIDAEHAVETSHGTFIVCYNDMTVSKIGRRQSISNVDRVSEVDVSGRVIRSFGGRRGSGTGQISQPFNLVIDVSGKVFVADYENSRVLVLSEKLELKRALLTKADDSIDKPWRLLYVESIGRLLIAANNGRVYIYNICRNINQTHNPALL